MSAVPPEINRSNSPRASLFRWLALGLLTCLLWGCGGGLSFDGGTIPPGGGSGSRLVGQAFDAENTSARVVGAVITLNENPVGGTPHYLSTTTDANGNFSFNTSNLTFATNQVSVTITPPHGSDRESQHLSFALPGGVNSTLLVALPSVHFNQQMVTSLVITNPVYQININDTIHVGAALLGQTGNVLPVTPSLVFEGGFGYLLPDGLFYSTGSGSANILALWDPTNGAGTAELQSMAQVTVSTATDTPSPPPPPVVKQTGTSPTNGKTTAPSSAP